MTNHNSELVSSLLDLGFSEREARVYMALLGKRNATATELQKLSGVPQSKIYEVIGGLVRHGYCAERKSGRKRTFEIINPEVTLNMSFDNLQKRLEKSKGARKKLLDLYYSSEKVAEPLEYIEVLRGNDNIHHRYCQLVGGTQKELLGFGRRPYACDTPEKSGEQDRESEKTLTRGVDIRWVFEISLPEEEWLVPDLKNLQSQGERIRVAEKLPIKMMIFDRELLLVAEEEPFSRSGELTMSVIKQKTVVNAFCALFEYFWLIGIELDVWENMQVSLRV